MIDLCQWRASIGLWNCCKWPCCIGKSSTLKGGWVLGRSKKKNKKPTFSLILFLSVLLILAGDVELNPGPVTDTSVITKVLLKVLDDCYESLSLALRFCLEDVAKDMFSKGLISESTMTSSNYDTVISEFKTGMKEKENIPQLEKHCRLFLTCLSSQGGPAEAVAEDLVEQWREEVQKELNISLSLDVVITDQDMKQMEIELVEANTEMTEHITTNEPQHLESLDIRDHFIELLRQFKHELHGKLEKGEEELSNIIDFVQQVVSTEDLCDVKDLDEVLKKLDCYYNFLDCQIIVLFAEQFASPALLQKFENHSKEAKMFCRSHTIKTLQNSLDVNFDSRQTNASISLHIAWGNVIIHGLYVLINQFSVKHKSHIVLKNITVTESSVHIEYLMRNTSMEIEEVIAHAQENVSFMKFMCFIGIYECTINEHIILQVNNEENFTFELALLDAARTGHNEAVQFLLELTDNTDHCNEEALMLASEGGYEAVVKSLVLAGANVNSQDNDGWTALMKASQNNHITIIHTLLEVGANPHLQNSDGVNTLMIASINGHYQIVEQLLRNNVDCNCQQQKGTTALIYASQHGHSNVVELLLNAQADPNTQDSDRRTALMIACFKGHFKVVELLLNKNADPNIQNSDRGTALMIACFKDHFKVIELLLNKNTDPNIQDRDGYTALMLASSKGDSKVVEVLLNKNANPNIQDSIGCTALMQASQHGYSQVVELLLQEADPNIQNTDGHTALRFANQNGHFATVELLLNYHANPNIQDMYGRTELHYAVLSSLNNKCGLLLKMMTGTVDIDAMTDKGFTSLMIATIHGCTEVVELLLEAGANPNIQIKTSTTMKDIIMSFEMDIMLQPQIKSFLLPNVSLFKGMSLFGWTALIIASFKGYLDIVQILLQANAQPDLQSGDRSTALLLAARRGHYKIVQQLLDCGANPNISDRDGMTSLHAAVHLLSMEHIKMNCEIAGLGSREDYLKTIQLLIAMPNILVNEIVGGYTSLHLASKYGCIDAVKLLLQVGADPNISTHTVEIGNNNELSFLPSNMLLQPQLKAFLLLNDFQTVSGCTALMFASANGHSEIVQLLLNAKAKPDLQHDNGETALHLAAMGGYPNIVQLLLEYGADPNISNRDGATAVQEIAYFASIAIGIARGEIVAKEANTFGITSDTYEHHLKIMKLLIAQPNIRMNTKHRGFTGLMGASRFGCTQIVELLLQAGADPNMSIQTPIHKHIIAQSLISEDPVVGNEIIGLTALMLACAGGHLNVVQLLLEAKANPNLRKTDHGITALIIAVQKGFLDIVRQLLKYGADPNICDRSGRTTIHCIMILNDKEIPRPSEKMMSDKLEILQLLIVRGIDVNKKDGNGMTALMIASINGFTKAVKILLQAGADPNIEHHIPINEKVFSTSTLPKTHTFRFTALTYASFQKNSEVVKLLLKFNANPNHALMIAAEQGYLDIVQQLLKYGADPNSIRDIDGSTALMIAAQQGHPDIVQQLLEYGGDPNIGDKTGCRVMHYIVIFKDTETLQSHKTIMSDKLEILQLLIVRGIDVNMKDGNGMTALMMASSSGFTEAVKLLLQAGADPNVERHIPVNEVFSTSCLPKTHTIGFTALMYATSSKQMNPEIVNLLLQANANPNQENAFALMIAAEQGYPDIVQQLLKYGADPNSISDIDGSTAIHHVLSQREALHIDGKENKLVIIHQLLEKSANIINIQNEDGLTALMIATYDGLSEVVELFLHNGADPNVQSNKGTTALMIACNHGNSKVAQHLLRYNANPQLVDNDGFTASIYALRCGNKDIAYELVNGRDFSQNELKCLLIMDLLEGDLIEAISRLDDITNLTTDKKELLISCVVGSLEDVVGKLHESGLHPDTPLVGGLSLLMIASSCGHIEIVEYLIILEADVNQRDIFWKYTPLFYAILGSKSNELVELLLANGADINAVAGKQTPLDMANSSPLENLTSSLLIEHGGQTFSEMTHAKSEMQLPIQKKSPHFAKFSDQVKSLIQDTVVKREHTEYTHVTACT